MGEDMESPLQGQVINPLQGEGGGFEAVWRVSGDSVKPCKNFTDKGESGVLVWVLSYFSSEKRKLQSNIVLFTSFVKKTYL